ncbi:MAG: hypothetical protein ACU0CO_07240 [Shimia sp.]
MRIGHIIAALAAFTLLSGCLDIDNDGERAVVGAVAGAIAADALGGDGTTGAVVGAAAGIFCDDAGICRR